MSETRPLYTHAQLRRLLNPASVAIIGATPRAGAFGERVLFNLGAYTGPHPPRERPLRKYRRPALPSLGRQTPGNPGLRRRHRRPRGGRGRRPGMHRRRRRGRHRLRLRLRRDGKTRAPRPTAAPRRAGPRIRHADHRAELHRRDAGRLGRAHHLHAVQRGPAAHARRRRRRQPVRRPRLRAVPGRRSRRLHQPRAYVRQFLRCRHGRLRRLPRG